MRHRRGVLVGTATCALTITALYLAYGSLSRVEAADHNDPPGRTTGATADKAADIGDLYAWHTADGKTVLVMTYAGPLDPTADQTATYDADVLYGFHVDTDADQVADHDIWVRFAQSPSGNWGMQVSGIPGGDPVVQEGPVELQNRIGGVTDGFFWAGLREDPFFFDLQGFTDTLSTGTLSFVNDRDFFAGKNISAIVLELETEDLEAGTDGVFEVWATTARIGG